MTTSLFPPQQDLTSGLNSAQREAVLHVEGPLLVLAGAGSGKTRVLTTRIAHLIENHGVDPRHVLALTFTNKAAGEMRDRIARLLGHEPKGMWMGTFHAIGARMVRAQAHLVGRTPSFTIYDEDDSLAVVRRVMERLKINDKAHAPKGILASISDAKNALVSPDEYARLAFESHAKSVAAVYSALEPAMRQANAVSFDDLLTLPVHVLEQHSALLEQYRARFRYILVDEYQDTNRAQYRFIALLGGSHGNVAVVGDDGPGTRRLGNPRRPVGGGTPAVKAPRGTVQHPVLRDAREEDMAAAFPALVVADRIHVAFEKFRDAGVARDSYEWSRD